jgi:uncharacterized protein involved in exopolysaccharide biosynthesis/Mrp family chromosome partitioning ATPase
MNIESSTMLQRGPITPNRYELSGNQFGSGVQDSLSVEAVLRFLRRSWRLCVLWMLVGLGLSVLFLAFTGPLYTAYSTLLLEDPFLEQTPEATTAANRSDGTYVDSQIQVLQSREVVGRVVDQFDLTKDEEFGGPVGGLRMAVVTAAPFLSAIIDSPNPETAADSVRHVTINRVSDALSVQRIGVSSAVQISFTSQDSQRAAAMANALAQAYIDSRIELRQRARAAAIEQLGKRLIETREKAFNSDLPIQDKTLRSPETEEQARGRFRELQNITETYRNLYSTLLQRYTEATQEPTFSGVRVITLAEPPLRRSWPPSFVVIALGIVLGGAAGIGQALLRQVTDDTLRTPEDLQRATGLECLAQIKRIQRRDWTPIASDAGSLQSAYKRISTSFDRCIAKIAVYLQAARVEAKGAIIGVAAVEEKGGASATAAHLARTVAQSGQKTLLVDANWRRTTADEQGIGPGGGEDLTFELSKHRMGLDRLDILLIRGGISANAVTASQSIVSALARLRGEYAWIVVDYHAVETTADVTASASLLDDLILVVEAGRTSSEALRSALRFLPREKTAIVLNMAAES